VFLNARMEQRQRTALLSTPPALVAEMEVEQKAVKPLVAAIQKVPQKLKALIDKLPRNEVSHCSQI